MREIYKHSKKFFAALFLACTSCISINAITTDQLYGTYKFTTTSATGIAPSEQVINIYPGSSEGEIFMNGWLGRSNNVAAKFDESSKTISIQSPSYIYANTAIGDDATVSMFFIANVGTNDAPDLNEITLKVADDGTISFENSIGAFAYVGWNAMCAGKYNGGGNDQTNKHFYQRR